MKSILFAILFLFCSQTFAQSLTPGETLILKWIAQKQKIEWMYRDSIRHAMNDRDSVSYLIDSTGNVGLLTVRDSIITQIRQWVDIVFRDSLTIPNPRWRRR